MIERGIMLSQSSERVIRHFQQEDLPLLGELYESVQTIEGSTFWWVGDEDNWSNVYCAFEDGKIAAKGQVSIISVISTGCTEKNKHCIYINLKTLSERQQDYVLLDELYNPLFKRAIELKSTLPPEYKTILCVGNDSKEAANNQFFIQKGYRPLNSLYHMTRDLTQSIPELTLSEEFEFSYWNMNTSSEEKEYLEIDTEIWPDAPLGLASLSEHKSNALWTSMIVRQSSTIVGGLMVWQEKDHGVIEDVFVREPWRKKGIARFLLTKALSYLQDHQLPFVDLTVLTTNQSALTLYESVGFDTDGEEVRYFVPLD